MIAIIFLCVMKSHLFAMFVWNFTTLACSLLRYCFLWKRWPKIADSNIARIGLCSVLRPRQHSIGYMGDGFYRSKDPTNSIKVLKMLQRKMQRTKTTKSTLPINTCVLTWRQPLDERLIEEWHDLDHNIICAAVNQWPTRLRACMRADGEHQL